MQRKSLTAFVPLVLVLGFIVGRVAEATGQDQPITVASAIRGPRFLLAPASGDVAPVEVDVHRHAALRRMVSLNFAQPTVGQILTAIERQAGFKIFYSRAVLSSERRVRLRADSITVAAALVEILIDTGVDVLLSQGQQIALVKRGKVTAVWQDGSIIGRVTDVKSGAVLPNTEVLLDGTKWRTTTDTAGWYRLTGVAPGSYALTVRRLGYAKQRRQVTVRDEREDTVDVALEPVAVPLNELVTTATGQQRRRDLGNAITTIRADSVLRTAPIRSLTDLLEDRVPGLTVQHTSGAPGDPAKSRLRGLGSATRSNDPVVIVDGIRVYAAQSETRSGNLTNRLSHRVGLSGSVIEDLSGPQLLGPFSNRVPTSGVPAPSPLDQIDPNIIEKIEVFKGPSAATLYGADAANGVIVITTKRGKPGPTRWNASMAIGRTVQPGRYPTGYYRWGHEGFDPTSPDQFCPLLFASSVSCVQDSVVEFQALNEPSLTVFGRGRRTELSLTASGGTQALTYSVTGSYSDEMGLLELPAFEVERFQDSFQRVAPEWMRRPHRYETWSVTSSVMARLSATADLTLSTSLSRSNQQRTSLENQVAALARTYIDTINGIYYPTGGAPGALGNTTQGILQDYYVRTTASTLTLTTGLAAAWRPRSWFAANGNAGLNIVPREDELFRPAGLVARTDSGTVARGTGRSLVSTLNVQGEIRKPLGLGFWFTTSMGANLTSTSTNDLTSRADGLIPGTSSISNAARIQAADGRTSTSVFGWYIEPRVAGDRLSLSTGLRLDGGSSYGTRISGGVLSLPKLNGSWVISEEPFFPFKGLFSSLRLRGAYGQAQVQPGPTDRLRLYTRDAQGGVLRLTGVGNTQLRPERSTEVEVGLDADLLDSRLSVELTMYRKTQVDALMPLQLPWSVNGGGNVITNIGNTRNTGLELSLKLTPVRSPWLTWSTLLNYSRNSNVLTKLGDRVLPNPRQGLVEGYPVRSRWALPILGFADANADGVLQRGEVQVGDSMVYMGRLLPAYTSSLHTDLVLLNGTVGINGVFSYDGGATQVDQMLFMNWVLHRAMVDPTAPQREQAALLAVNEVQRGSPATDYGMMQTISTFRFQSVSVSYRAPAPVARLLQAQQLTLALQGRNLALHSTYRGKDPDVNAWSAGDHIADLGQLSQPRTWRLAVSLQY